MNYTFKPAKLEDIAELVQENLDTLSSLIESFLGDHIIKKQLYVISSISADYVGYFAAYGKAFN